MRKVLWFDTETTGLNEKESTVVQIAGLVEIDNVIEETFDFRTRPFRSSVIKESALKVNGLTEEEIWSWPKPSDMHDILIEMFDSYINKFDKNDKFIIAGHNIDFDYKFLDAFFKNLDDKYLGSYLNSRLRFDTMDMAKFLRAMGKLDTPSIKLVDLCNVFGIEYKAHDGLEDIKANYTLFKGMLKLMDSEELYYE